MDTAEVRDLYLLFFLSGTPTIRRKEEGGHRWTASANGPSSNSLLVPFYDALERRD